MADMKPRPLFSSLLRNLLAAIVALAAVAADAQTICPARMVSRAANGNSPGGPSWEPSANLDGRYVTFRSTATNVVEPPIDVTLSHLYRHDLLTGTTEPLHAAQPGMGWSDQTTGGRIAGDGRSVVFQSPAGDIIPGDQNGNDDVFLRTFGSGALEMISVPDRNVVLQKKVTRTARGGFAGSVDHTGENVAFLSTSSLLTLDYFSIPDDKTRTHLFVRNRALGRTFRVTRTAMDGQAVDEGAGRPFMAGNGQVLVFASFATNLKGFERTIRKWDIYVAVFNGAEWVLQQRIDTGTPGLQDGENIAISPDGRYVAWVARTGAGDELMLFDRSRGTTGNVRPPEIPTHAGRRVTQPVLAVNGLAWLDHLDYTGEGVGGAFYLELGLGGRIHRVGRDIDGQPLRHGTNGLSNPPDELAISGDGRFVLYRSASAFVDEPDHNGTWDIFVQDMRPCLDIDLAAIEPRPFINTEWTDVIADPNEAAARLAALDAPEVMTAIAADGAARLIVRAIVAEAGTLRFTPRFRDEGAHPQCVVRPLIRALDSAVLGDSVAVATVPLTEGRHVAFAVLPAPEEFVRRTAACRIEADLTAASLDIDLEAVLTRGDGTTAGTHTALRVHRPPVMLVHGIWSSPGTWTWELPHGFRVYRADYETTHAAHYAENVPRAARQISNAIHDMNHRGIATARADVVGHSMGGLLARHWAAGTFDGAPAPRPEPYRQPANFMRGAIRRFIPMNSPQFGADIANVMVAQMQRRPRLFRRFFRFAGKCLDCGAVEDLQIPPSSPLSQWQPTAVQAHAITGTGGEEGLDFSLTLASLALRVLLGVSYQDVYGNCVDDGVVALFSQEAGLDALRTTPFDGAASLHGHVTKEIGQRNAAVDLLDGPPGAFTTMPDGPRTPSPCAVNVAPFAPTVAAGGLRLNAIPPLIAAFAPGDVLQIQIIPIRPFVPAEAWLMTSRGEMLEASGSPLTVSYTIPAGASGVIRLIGVARDANGDIVNSPEARARITNAALLSLRFDADSGELRLSSGDPRQRARIIGSFHDGLERDVQGGRLTTGGVATPVVFETSNPAVATVTAEGLVIGHEPGDVALSARVGTVAATLSVNVEGAASPQCADGHDNDGDGLADFAGGDPGCRSATDLTETGGTGECDDGIDNDLDGAIDFGGDSGCTAFADFETEPPVADFQYECEGTTCTFFGEVSRSERSLVSYLWNFGDGSPAVEGPRPVHPFAAAGARTVTLTVTDDAGAADTRSWTVSIPNLPPVAAFTFHCAGLTCTVDGSASMDDAGIAQYSWDWGDEAHDEGAQADHTYPGDGCFTVTLRVSDHGGLTATASKTVVVSASGVAALDGVRADVHASAASTGNRNAFAEPGERVVLELTRVHPGPAGALTGVLSTTDPGIQIHDATADYGFVETNASTDCWTTGNCYEVTVNGGPRPATHWDAPVTETGPHTKTFSMHVGNSFSDVPQAAPYYRAVESVLHAKITGGCGAGMFCPDRVVTRAEMSVFVLAAKEGPNWTPPPCTTDPFLDVKCSDFAARHIAEVAARGISAGCGGQKFCPASAMTRASAAVFLIKTLDPNATLQPCQGMFSDVPSSNPACPFIEEMSRRGITAGCGNNQFCPNNQLTRWQAAVFLTSTFSLPSPGRVCTTP